MQVDVHSCFIDFSPCLVTIHLLCYVGYQELNCVHIPKLVNCTADLTLTSAQATSIWATYCCSQTTYVKYRNASCKYIQANGGKRSRPHLYGDKSSPGTSTNVGHAAWAA